MGGETDGIQQVGEIAVVVRRDSSSVVDPEQAYRSGATAAYSTIARWAVERAAAFGPYEGTGILTELQELLADRIREVNDGKAG